MAARLKIVWPGASGPHARLGKFYAYSAIFHILLVVFFVFAPRLFGSSRPNFSDEFIDSISAQLVGDIDDAPQAAQPVVEEPKPDPPKPKPEPIAEEAEAAGDVVHSKKAEPTPKKEDPEPQPTQSEPVADAGERVGDSTGGVQGSGEISLFGWYQGSVSRALYATWHRPVLAGQREPLEVRIVFNIHKDGSVTGLRIAESSGVPALDRTALRAVTDASPFPRLPPAWTGSSMTAAYVFELTPEDF